MKLDGRYSHECRNDSIEEVDESGSIKNTLPIAGSEYHVLQT